MALSIAHPQEMSWLSDRDWQAPNETTTLPAQGTLTGDPPGSRELRFPFEGGELVLEIIGDPPAWVEPTVRSLGGLLRLGRNWDSYGGHPSDPRCAKAAIELALNTFNDDTPIPSVVPTSTGGLQFEWHTGGMDLEVEFFSATRVCGLFEDRITGAAWEKDLTFDRQPLVEAISMLSQRK